MLVYMLFYSCVYLGNVGVVGPNNYFDTYKDWMCFILDAKMQKNYIQAL